MNNSLNIGIILDLSGGTALGGGTGPVSGDALLLEDGSYILLETGFKILLE